MEEEIQVTNFAELSRYLEKRITDVVQCYEKLVEPYQMEYGINISGMSKKEKEEFINKRNCLLIQKHCYNEIKNLIIEEGE